MRLARSPRRSESALVVVVIVFEVIAAATGCSSSSPAASGAGGRGGGAAGGAGAHAGTAGGSAAAGAGGTAAGGSGVAGASGTAGASAGTAGTSVGSGGANGGTAGGAGGTGGAGTTGTAGRGGSAAAGTSGGTAGASGGASGSAGGVGASGGASGSAGASGAGGSAVAGYYITGDVDGVTVRAEMGAVAYWWSGIVTGTIAADASAASWAWSLIVVNGTNVASNCSAAEIFLSPPGHPEMGFAKSNGGSCSVQVTQAAPNVGDILEGTFTATLANPAHTQTKEVRTAVFAFRAWPSRRRPEQPPAWRSVAPGRQVGSANARFHVEALQSAFGFGVWREVNMKTYRGAYSALAVVVAVGCGGGGSNGNKDSGTPTNDAAAVDRPDDMGGNDAPSGVDATDASDGPRDTGTVSDAGCTPATCDVYAGHYAGTYRIYTDERLGSSIINMMECVGTSSIDIDFQTDAGSPVRGTLSCTYAGGLTLFSHTQTGTDRSRDVAARRDAEWPHPAPIRFLDQLDRTDVQLHRNDRCGGDAQHHRHGIVAAERGVGGRVGRGHHGRRHARWNRGRRNGRYRRRWWERRRGRHRWTRRNWWYGGRWNGRWRRYRRWGRNRRPRRSRWRCGRRGGNRRRWRQRWGNRRRKWRRWRNRWTWRQRWRDRWKWRQRWNRRRCRRRRRGGSRRRCGSRRRGNLTPQSFFCNRDSRSSSARAGRRTRGDQR